MRFFVPIISRKIFLSQRLNMSLLETKVNKKIICVLIIIFIIT